MTIKKKLSMLFSVFIITLILISCSKEEPNVSYAIIIVINDKEYNYISEKIDKINVIGEEIGEITKKTSPDAMPNNNQSNYYEVGTKIFSVKDTDEYIVTIDKNNNSNLLKKVE